VLRVWGRRNSANVQKVLWLIGELGLDYEHIPAGGAFGGLDTPAFLAMNPHGRIPVIEDGDLVAWESHAILRYIAARYGQGRFWDADPAVRARHEAWMDWTQTDLQPAFVGGVFWGYYRTPEDQRNWPAIEASLRQCAVLFGRLDHAVAARPYLGGPDPSLADITAGAALYRYFELDITRPELPNVAAWYDRLRSRPAYREHVMVAFDDLKGRLSF
jgi:glutathione S-transferase